MVTPARIVVLLTALAALTIPATNAAATLKGVPPGVSGANQYTETLPGPGGNEPTDGGAAGGRPAEALGRADARQLEELGPEGRAAARLAAAGAPEPSQAERSGMRTGQTKGRSNSAGSSGFGQVLGQVTGTSDSGGMGLLLPLLIALTIVLAAAYMLGRRHLAERRD